MTAGGREERLFHTLDALRGVAALAVAVRHFSPLLENVLPFSSYLAVDFFFCLSGFVIAYAYEHRLGTTLGWGAFMARRLIRLYPLYLLALAIAVLGYGAQYAPEDVATRIPSLLGSVVIALAFIPVPQHLPFISVPLVQLDAPIWSISFEIIANAAYAAVAMHLTTKRLAAWLVLCAVLLCLTASHYGSLDVGWSLANFAGGLARVAFSFPAGVLLYRLWSQRRNSIEAPPAVLLAVLAVALCVGPFGRWQPVFDLVAALAGFPLLVFVAASSEPLHAVSRRVFAALGAASYALYVLHTPVLACARALSQRTGIVIAHPYGGLMLLIVVCCAAFALDSTYDRPLRRRLTASLAVRTAR